jgi:predicted DNA-binding protein
MPPPEAFRRPPVPKPKRSPVTFRLTEADEDALHALAKRAQLGASSFARRIVEHYIREHAPHAGAKRS